MGSYCLRFTYSCFTNSRSSYQRFTIPCFIDPDEPSADQHVIYSGLFDTLLKLANYS